MDYIPVYHSLQELFPQVDSRMLEVTAKHSKDADAAVEYILTEVLPIMTEKTKISSRNLSSFGLSDVEVEQEDQSLLPRRHNGGNRLAKLVIKEIVSDIVHDGIDGYHHPSEILDVEVVTNTVSHNALELRGTNENQNMEMKELSTLYSHCDYGQSKMRGNAEAEKLTLLGVERTVGSCSNTSCITRTVIVANSLSGLPFSGTVYSDASDHWKSNDEGTHSNGPPADADNLTIHFVPPPSHELQSNNEELETVSFISNVAPLEDIEASLDCTSNIGVEDIEAAMVTSTCGYNGYGDAREEDGSPLGMTAARSEQICSIDLLEQIIDDAKNNKKTLFSAVELVINTMKEVEDRERAMEKAKEEEAEMGGVDMITKVMELKQMLVHAEGANDMHTGEVYGEKAVLATEVRELQSRLRSLSEERVKALAVLDEMSKIMEFRIAEADEARLAAEKEKLKKEESARAALAEQEAVMEKVVQESKILQEATEENSKLRDFLIDRGRDVDILQGEISVICQDVRLLKEKFDARVPLSQSVSSSQTSVLLASSGSSRRNLSNSVNLNDVEAEIPEKSIELMSFVGVLRKDDFEEAKGRTDSELDDMGWEFFDKDA